TLENHRGDSKGTAPRFWFSLIVEVALHTISCPREANSDRQIHSGRCLFSGNGAMARRLTPRNTQRPDSASQPPRTHPIRGRPVTLSADITHSDHTLLSLHHPRPSQRPG